MPQHENVDSNNHPMGPLEEGDQAIVNAVEQLPAGNFSSDGGFIDRTKDRWSGSDHIDETKFAFLDRGSIQMATVEIAKSGISAHIVTEGAPGNDSHIAEFASKGNKSRSRNSDDVSHETDRKTAQDIKLRTAQRILKAAKIVPTDIQKK